LNLKATIQNMRVCGMSADEILRALECIEPDTRDEQAERRREKDRERKAEARLRNSADNTAQKGFDKERFHTSKEITSKTITIGTNQRAREPAEAPASRGTRLPENFTPLPAIVQQGLSLGLTEADISDQLERFRDWANAATGQVSIKRDWQAAYRNWIKRVADDRKKQQRFTGKQSPGDKMRQAFDDLDAEVARRRQAAGP